MFVFRELSPGTYEVRASTEGRTHAGSSTVEVAAGDVRTITLTLAPLAEQVDVTASSDVRGQATTADR